MSTFGLLLATTYHLTFPVEEVCLRKLTSIAALCIWFLMPRFAHAQEFDAAIGFGTLTASSGSVALANGENVTERGGLYPTFSADFIIKHRLGVSGNMAWRASRNLYA